MMKIGKHRVSVRGGDAEDVTATKVNGETPFP